MALSIEKQDKIQSLHSKGCGITEIAKKIGCSRNTVYKYLPFDLPEFISKSLKGLLTRADLPRTHTLGDGVIYQLDTIEYYRCKCCDESFTCVGYRRVDE